MKKNKEFEKGLKTVINTIISGMKKEDKENPIFTHLLKYMKSIDNPDEFNCLALFPIERVVGTWLEARFKKSNHLARSIYLNYNFFENNVSELCSKMYGLGCSVDKGRFLVKQAIQWKETGKLPVFNWKQEYTFHYPETGTPRQWMNFIEGLSDLLYGRNERYLLALKELMDTHSKKIKKEKKK